MDQFQKSKIIQKSAWCLSIALSVLLSVPIVASAADTPEPELRHFVALKFKSTATEEQVREIEKDFSDLKSKIPQVASIEWGKNVSPENLNKGFTDGFLVTFHTKEDRDEYLTHPEHLKFKETALPLVDEVLVLDFWSKP